MSIPQTQYADWKAPAQDGEVLLWPAANELLADAERNHKLLSRSDALIQGVPLRDLRRQLRAFVGHINDDQLLFATGHQTELHHPGVWAKNALIDAAANRTGGAAYHVAVDTDHPKHLRLRWPGFTGEPITDYPSLPDEPWTSAVESPTPAHVDHLQAELSAATATWGYRPMALDFLDSLRRLALENVDLARSLTNASHAMDWSLGLRHHALLASPLFTSDAYLTFVYHIHARADQFAADYNAILDEYRREHGIRTPGRPMPNLKVDGDIVELPFWVDDLRHTIRGRASIGRKDGVWYSGSMPLRPTDDAAKGVAELREYLRAQQVRVSPRALTLTMFLRLMFADQFVHGIGGARYDQIADRLIRRHFGIEPPRFSVTTATLYSPQAVGRAKACMSCVKQEGHRLRHNVIDRKRELVDAIAAAPRGSSQRSRLFSSMHDQLAAASSHPAIRAWEQRLADAALEDAQDRDLFDRELFYGIQPAERLTSLIERYRTAFAN